MRIDPTLAVSDEDYVEALHEEDRQRHAFDERHADRLFGHTPRTLAEVFAEWDRALPNHPFGWYCDRPSDLERDRTRADLTLDRDAA